MLSNYTPCIVNPPVHRHKGLRSEALVQIRNRTQKAKVRSLKHPREKKWSVSLPKDFPGFHGVPGAFP
jgi:hypothetical protein